MGVIGISLIVASLVCFCIYPNAWLDLARPLLPWLRPPPPNLPGTDVARAKEETQEAHETPGTQGTADIETMTVSREPQLIPAPAPVPAENTSAPERGQNEDGDDDQDEATTPKATPAPGSGSGVPAFSLSVLGEDGDGDSGSDDDDDLPPPMFPSPFSAQRASGPVVASSARPPSASSQSMRPPPLPSSLASARRPMPPPPRPTPRGPPTLNPVRGAASTPGSSLRPAGLLPVPNRGGPPSRLTPSPGPSGLSPFVTPSSTPLSSSRARNKVSLAPGHSPLDWAHRCADPTANLRNLPADAPQLLRVKPSLLKTMNGRRGCDAWTALGGMVYNITPYVPFHPGGAGELLRCAGKDGTRLFQEVHAWVNYDNMLAACRIGILVDESHASSVAGPMEEMD